MLKARYGILFLLGLIFLAVPAVSVPIAPEQLVGCQYNSTPLVLTDGQVATLQCGSDGKLSISVSASATVTVAALTSTNLSGSIAVTDTFQSIQASTAGRKGCAVQNPSANSHSQWVFFTGIGSATKAAAFQLSPGSSISCAVGGLAVLTDQVSITGTSGDIFVANFQ